LQQVPVNAFAHQTLKDAFHRYAIIGGMPEVIKMDIDKHSLSDLSIICLIYPTTEIHPPLKADLKKASRL
jgi:hypothetical protein